MPDDPIAKQALLDATRLLYRAFANCRGQSNWVDCLDDCSLEYASRPARMPAKELSDEDVNYFFSHSGYTMRHVDLVNGVNYFLPRVLSAYSAQEQGDAWKYEMVFDAWFIAERLTEARWREWPVERVGAVDHWFEAWLNAILRYQPAGSVEARYRSRTPRNREVELWLDFACALNFDTAPLVTGISTGDDWSAVILVRACLSQFKKTLLCKHVLWDSTDPTKQQPLLRWLLQWNTEQRLENAFFRCTHPADAHHVSTTLETLRNYKAALPSYGA